MGCPNSSNCSGCEVGCLSTPRLETGHRLGAWSSVTAISCCARGPRTTCRRSLRPATTRRSRAGSRSFRRRTPRTTRCAFVRGEVSAGPEHSFAITLDGVVVGAIGMSVIAPETTGRIGYWVRGDCARPGHLHASASVSSVAFGFRRARARAARADHRTRTTTRPSASPRRSDSGGRASCAHTCATRTAAFATR